VLDPTCRALVLQYMNIQLADNVKARTLNSEGKWEKVEVEPDASRVDAQQSLIVLAYDRARKARENLDVPLVPEASVVPPIPEVLHGAPARQIVVSEASEPGIDEVEIHIDEAGPIDVFSEDVPKTEGQPAPSVIARAHVRVQEHVQERVQEIQERREAAEEAVREGRLRRAFGHFGAGLRTLFRGE
jgi:polyphosphate kinase